MVEAVRAAVIGCGRMGAFTSDSVRRFAPRCWFPLSHCEAIQLHPKLDLLALCDTDAAMLQRAASAHGSPSSFTDHGALLNVARPELLGVATRTIGRAQIILDAVASGTRAIHAEKPLCSSVRELWRLREAFARADIFVTLGTVRRFFPVYVFAVNLARSGRYGDLREIRVQMGPGSLYWTHPHSVDLILFAAGTRRVDSVQARLGNFVAGDSAAEVVSDPIIESASIYFSDGLVGQITRGLGADLTLSCSAAEITVESDGRALRVAATSGDDPYPVSSYLPDEWNTESAGGTFLPVSHLVRCLEGDTVEGAHNAELKAHIVLGQQILFALAQSHLEQSKLVRIDEVDPELRILAMTANRYA